MSKEDIEKIRWDNLQERFKKREIKGWNSALKEAINAVYEEVSIINNSMLRENIKIRLEGLLK